MHLESVHEERVLAPVHRQLPAHLAHRSRNNRADCLRRGGAEHSPLLIVHYAARCAIVPIGARSYGFFSLLFWINLAHK